MRYLFTIFLFISLAVQAQVFPKIKSIQNGYSATFVITGAQLAAGTPITILGGRGGSISLADVSFYLDFHAGSVAITGTGTDSTLIYMVIDGVKKNLVKIEDAFFNADHEWNVSGDGQTKVNTSIVFDPATQLTGGTGAYLVIIIDYKIKQKVIYP